MPAYVSKTPISIKMPNGKYCALYNDFVSGYEAKYYKSSTDAKNKVSPFLKLTMTQGVEYRCLQYQTYTGLYSDGTAVRVIPYVKDEATTEGGTIVSEALYECITPMSLTSNELNGANVLFWTNLIEGTTFAENPVQTETGGKISSDYTSNQYVYDSNSIWKITREEMNSFVFNSGKITRALCSVQIEFRNVYEVLGTSGDANYICLPIAKNLVVLKMVTGDSPVLDFSVGTGGGVSSSGGIGRHGHIDNADGGFAFAVFHPGTGVPLNIPWKR